jgi:hypothetical protein
MVYRYAAEQTDDGLSGEEGTFNMRTLSLREACLIFEKLVGWRII